MAAIIHTAEFESSLGTIRVASSERGLAYVALPLTNGRGFMGWLQRYGDDAVPVPDPRANQKVIGELIEFIDGEREAFDLDLDLRATDFQRNVYDVVAKIPFGDTLTYGEVAKAAGCPKAQRAVGAALGANPLPLVIPCHRVVGSHGKLQGYAGGLDIKAQLLASEASASGSGRLF